MIFFQVQERAIHTGRLVPKKLLTETLEEVPKSVNKLAPLVDYHVDLRNPPQADDIELVTPNETWNEFTSKWVQ
jgi:hypothetical protein